MSMKSEEQVTAEIAALQAIRPKVPQYTAMHDDNRAGIDLQIAVLTERLDGDQVHQKYLGTVTDHNFFEALHASDWLNNLLDPEDDGAPSASWQHLIE